MPYARAVAHLRELRRVDQGFVETAPLRYSNSIDLAISPEHLFELFEDAGSWPRWVSSLTEVVWTSPRPFGPGTTRTVHLRTGIVGDEEFFTWDAPTRIAFRFNAASTRLVSAFSERYDVEPTPDGCRLTWSVGVDVPGPRRLTALGRPVMDRVLRGDLRRLRRYTDGLRAK